MQDLMVEGPTGWKAKAEKLLALIVLNDSEAAKLSSCVGEAFFCAFIVQDRATGAVRMNFRFRYEDHDAWYTAIGKPGPVADAVEDLRAGILAIVIEAAGLMGVTLADGDVISVEPPDDGGDWERTARWLLALDLIHLVGGQA